MLWARWDAAATCEVVLSPSVCYSLLYLRSKLLVLFLTDSASCNCILVAFPAGILKLFSAVFLVQSLISVK